MIEGADEKLARQLLAWAGGGETDEVRAARAASVRKVLAEGASPEDLVRVEELLKTAATSLDADEEEAPVAKPKRKKRTRALLYSPERRGHMRSTREQGIGEELRKMSIEATGTPFFDEEVKAPVKEQSAVESKVRQEVARRLEEAKKKLAAKTESSK